MEFTIAASSLVTFEGKDGDQGSVHRGTEVMLDLSDILEESQYISPNGSPTINGTKAISVCFIQGLIGNIHAAHESGQWDSAAHLRYIIAELERGFATVAEVEIGESHRA